MFKSTQQHYSQTNDFQRRSDFQGHFSQRSYKHHQHQHHQLNHKTSICKYAKIGCKQKDTCWYAHNMDELKYRYCSSGSSCSKQDCPFVHGNELPDKNVYYLRIILNSNIIGIDNNLITKELNILANKEIKQKQINTYDKFIIELDEENDDNEDEVLDKLSELDIGKWGDYNEELEDNELKNVDLELSNYINDITEKWNDKTERENFYEKRQETEIKKDINMMVHVSDSEFNEILRYLESMNIEYVKM